MGNVHMGFTEALRAKNSRIYIGGDRGIMDNEMEATSIGCVYIYIEGERERLGLYRGSIWCFMRCLYRQGFAASKLNGVAQASASILDRLFIWDVWVPWNSSHMWVRPGLYSDFCMFWAGSPDFI